MRYNFNFLSNPFIIYSAFALPFAMSFFLQYVIGLQPCVLCNAERILHLVSLISLLIFMRSGVLYITYIIMLINFGTTICHILVEYGVFNFTCDGISVANFYKTTIDCRNAKYFLGVKLTFWNIITLSGQAVLVYLYQLRLNKKLS